MAETPPSPLPQWLLPQAGRRAALRAGLAAAAALAIPGCALPVRQPAVPRGQGGLASVLGVPGERFRVENGIEPFNREAMGALQRSAQRLGVTDLQRLPPLNLLAISGGGEAGAFGAGLLCGWTAHGSRPSFDLVTGVSTGALTAPFAFIGPDGDAGLREVYTQVTLADIARSRGLLAALLDDALADTLPLLGTVSRYLNEGMQARIAQGYREGRSLLVGTTDLDAQLPVIWNIGAIAASDHPGALALIRRVLLASAAIPGAFPPVMFDVSLDGRNYQEMHVDGGAINQAFLYPPALTAPRRELIARGRPVRPANIYLIRNARLDPEWAAVERRTLGITGRAISTMLAASGFNDVLRVWALATRDRMTFNLAFIGTDFDVPYNAPFDQAYMRPLFDNGFNRARRGFEWAHEPPLIDGQPVGPGQPPR